MSTPTHTRTHACANYSVSRSCQHHRQAKKPDTLQVSTTSHNTKAKEQNNNASSLHAKQSHSPPHTHPGRTSKTPQLTDSMAVSCCPHHNIFPVRCLNAEKIARLEQALDGLLETTRSKPNSKECIACNPPYAQMWYSTAGEAIHQRTKLCEYCYDTLLMQRPHQPLGRLSATAVQLIRLRETITANQFHVCLFPLQSKLARKVLTRKVHPNDLLQQKQANFTKPGKNHAVKLCLM